jgi:hypothetical protein
MVPLKPLSELPIEKQTSWTVQIKINVQTHLPLLLDKIAELGYPFLIQNDSSEYRYYLDYVQDRYPMKEAVSDPDFVVYLDWYSDIEYRIDRYIEFMVRTGLGCFYIKPELSENQTFTHLTFKNDPDDIGFFVGEPLIMKNRILSRDYIKNNDDRKIDIKFLGLK